MGISPSVTPMSDHDLGGPAPLAPSTAYLDRMEEETARRAARTSPIDSPYAGAPEEGEAVLAPLRALAPVGDALTVRPYTAFQSMFDASWVAGFHNYWKAEYLTELSDGAIEEAARYALAHSSPLSDFISPASEI